MLKNPLPHCHDPTIGYTIATYKKAISINDEILILSATAPEIIVAAVAANIPWNRKSVQ